MQLKRNKKFTFNAFSLIEVIIVLVIIASITSASLPNYHSYLVKSKVIESLNLLSQFKIDIYEYYFSNSEMPSSGEKIFNGQDSFIFKNNKKFIDVKYINDLNNSGKIALAIKLKDNNLNGNNYVYAWAKFNGESLDWDCGSNGASDSVPKSYYPKSCNL